MRWKREVDALTRIEVHRQNLAHDDGLGHHHNHFPIIHSFGPKEQEEQGEPTESYDEKTVKYIVMDRIQGVDLFDIQYLGWVSSSVCKNIMCQLECALAQLRKIYITHNDLAPCNIMLVFKNDSGKIVEYTTFDASKGDRVHINIIDFARANVQSLDTCAYHSDDQDSLWNVENTLKQLMKHHQYRLNNNNEIDKIFH